MSESLHVVALRTFPAAGEPPVEHASVEVSEVGLAGDRPRKAAVSVVGVDRVTARSNVVLSVPTAEVEALAGLVVRIGDVLLALEATGSSCPGLYAAVGQAGSVAVGDAVVPVD